MLVPDKGSGTRGVSPGSQGVLSLPGSSHPLLLYSHPLCLFAAMLSKPLDAMGSDTDHLRIPEKGRERKGREKGSLVWVTQSTLPQLSL